MELAPEESFAGVHAFDMLRMEAGVPRSGVDMNGTLTPAYLFISPGGGVGG